MFVISARVGTVYALYVKEREQNNTSTPFLGLHGLLQGDLYLYLCST